MSVERKSLFLLAGPFLFLWIFFWVIPFLGGFDLSFRATAPGSESNILLFDAGEKIKHAGFENYRRVVTDSRFWKSISNSCYYVFGSLLFILPLSFLMAICLLSLKGIFRSVMAFVLIIPGLAIPGVLSTMFYLFFHGREGALNQYLVMPLGFDPINWMMDPNFIMPSMIFQAVWRWTGLVTLLFLCALEGVPRWQLEIAKMEGLGNWDKVACIWFPSVRKLMLFAAIFLTVEGFASFSGAYVLLGGSGGILDSGLLFVTYLYQVAFPGGSGRFDFPTASAMSMLVAPIMALILFVVLKFERFSKLK